MATASRSPDEVCSTIKSLETSPSKSQGSSSIYGKGKAVGKGTTISKKKGLGGK